VQPPAHFVKIAALANMPAPAPNGGVSVVDVMGVVHSVGQCSTLARKDGSSTEKRSVMVRDDSGSEVELTLWPPYSSREGEQLEQLLFQGKHPVLAVRAARLAEFQGRNLGTISSTVLEWDPPGPAAQQLRAWYDGGGNVAPVVPLGGGGGGGGGRSDRVVTVATLREETAAGVPQPVYVLIRAYVVSATPNPETGVVYPACPRLMDGQPAGGRTCMKKLKQADGGGSWYCERHALSVESPDWRYMLTLRIADHSGTSINVSGFGEIGERLFGLDGTALHGVFSNNYQEYERLFKEVPWSVHNFKIKAVEDNYQDEKRVKFSIQSVSAVNYADESRKMLESLARLARGEPAEAPAPPPRLMGAGGMGGGGMGGGYAAGDNFAGGSGGGGGRGYGGGGGGGDKGACRKCGQPGALLLRASALSPDR